MSKSFLHINFVLNCIHKHNKLLINNFMLDSFDSLVELGNFVVDFTDE